MKQGYNEFVNAQACGATVIKIDTVVYIALEAQAKRDHSLWKCEFLNTHFPKFKSAQVSNVDALFK